MIVILLKDLRWRLLALLLIAMVLFALEPGFHQHEGLDLDAIALGPLGVSATLSYFAGLSMIVLLAGFVSTDRREGYTRLYFAHPTAPLAYYAARWLVAYLISLSGAVLFLFIGQLIAWGEILGGTAGLILPALSALVYGGLIAFFSVLLPRGDAWAAFLLFLPTFFPQILSLGLSRAIPAVRQIVLLLLPPQGALQQVWEGLLLGSFSWGGLLFALSYGSVLLLATVLLLQLKEWP